MVSAPSSSGISALLRGVRGAQVAMAPRPEGPLVWMHLPAELPAEMLAALKAGFEDVSILVTGRAPAEDETLSAPLPGPRKAAIDQFIAHWRPDLLLWGTPENGLAICRRAKRAGIKMLLADTTGEGFMAGYRGRQINEFLAHFERVLLEAPAGQADLKKLDLAESQIAVCKPLSEIAAPMPENEPLLKRIAAALGPRPVWCAAGVSRGEIGTLLAAHRHAVMAIPNLLMIVVPRAASEFIETIIQKDGWRLATADTRTRPDKHVEVLLAQNCDELAVWMRLASVSYMGGTLYGPEAADPFSAVALGSAVLCGPMHAPFEARYQRLAAGNALAMVESKNALPARLVAALAPDASALLAMQAWNIGSEGAEAVQTITREINTLLAAEAS